MEKYSEKELNIFRGVFLLAQQGVSLGDITARGIARAAGVGKATIYDYFSSKEEILVRAMVYALEKEIDATDRRLTERHTFRDKMMYIYNDIVTKVENSLSVFNFFASMGSSEKMQASFHQPEHCRMLEALAQHMENTIGGVIAFGRQTGEITATDMDYIYMTVTASIFTTGKMRADKKIPSAKICENAYTMLIKALN